jgi:chromosome segregation protein
MEAEHATAQAAASGAGEALRTARTAHLAARDAHDEAARAARVAHEARAAADAAVLRAQDRAGRADAELAALDAERPAEASDELPGDDADQRLSELEASADAVRARRAGLAARRDEAREAWTATRRAAEEAQHRAVSTRTEHAAREGRAAQLRSSLSARRAARDEQRSEAEAMRSPLAEARQRAADAEQAVNEADARRAARRSELQQLEQAVGGAGGRLAELERASQAAAIEASRRDEALASLLREREMALESLPEVAGDAEAPTELIEEIEGLDDDAVETELRRVRRTLSQIGSVNPFAVEEHRELATRLEEMSGQDADLRGAIESTEALIATLDAEIAGQFDAAFRAIGEKFDEYCRLLFAGGSAALQMGDEAADGEAPGGIEIVVRPPGKRLQRLAMLSGGERALTGVALLFAMLTVNPVPFCILDEVDAALDEANIGRFAEALRRLSESIDFVVITHNRATIEVADTIYGVTMTDAAVSRVLSLRLADVPAEVSA